ncbi:ABC transporter ATP-binding protein [Cupriavidus neocaledonicus]|uniref:Polysialic acid transport ATP-binding protein n=1 Tax=Cupriavidus neocaledonicus TaxID=1040979 RepID=A0A375HTJ6_9BURK|nr:ABC transporter ATP-binding protein [Cupriavidus neocaledonicus]SOZ38293.1 Polysialic acid transport ATP-binding protein [Cupriavidus neocaledonicus]SPD60067.1 Polysialic acid transport ATP-binding protein KpsT [Cupriavidus neocaledonicus]
MIEITDVHKRYRTIHGSKWVLQGVTLRIPQKSRVALIGANGAGKSTLLRLVGGIDQPNRGSIVRNCRVSWPLGLSGGFQGSLSGRQNTKFVCRIHGIHGALAEKLEFVREFSELHDAFDDPVKTYSSGMRSRLAFAMSLAFDFDTYLVDELTAVGDAAFKRKSQKAFEDLAGRAGLVMVSHSESTLKNFCQSAVWLHQGQAHWFDSVEEALHAYRDSIPA